MNENQELKNRELKRTLRILLDSVIGRIGILIILILVLIAIFAPLFAPYDPYVTSMGERLQSPNLKHFFGTDNLGRDVFTRVLYGARTSLFAGIIVVGIALLIGILVGLSAGYPGGAKGGIIMRITDIFLAFPTLILAIALASTLGPSFFNAIIAISIVYWPKYARLIYGLSLSIKEQDYIKFSEIIGKSAIKIRFFDILPNCFSSLIVQSTLDLGDTILFFAALSFLGLGAQPPVAEWGSMVSGAQNYMMVAWWMPLFPGITIFLVVLGFNLLGDAIRDSLDPNLRNIKIFKASRVRNLSKNKI